jgi:hypothetical protein
MNAKQTIGITLSTAVLALVMFTSWHVASLTPAHGTQLVAQAYGDPDGGPDGIDVDGGPDGGPLG